MRKVPAPRDTSRHSHGNVGDGDFLFSSWFLLLCWKWLLGELTSYSPPEGAQDFMLSLTAVCLADNKARAKKKEKEMEGLVCSSS